MQSAIEQLKEGLKLLGLYDRCPGGRASGHGGSSVQGHRIQYNRLYKEDKGANSKKRQKDVYERLCNWLEGIEDGWMAFFY